MSDGAKTTPPGALDGGPDDDPTEQAILPPDDEITAEYPEPPLGGFSPDEEPTIERFVPAAVAATRREDEFRTVHVTFSEILQRVGPQHLGGPLPPIRDELYTTEPSTAPSARSDEPASTTELDSEWNEETQKG